MKREFKIICINDTKGITDWSMSISKLSVFHTDIYSYNYGGDGRSQRGLFEITP